jgi:hypothetical protein
MPSLIARPFQFDRGGLPPSVAVCDGRSHIGRMPVCTENLVRIDPVRESNNFGRDGPVDFAVLNLFATVFRSKSRLEAENAALRQQLIVLQRKIQGRVQFTTRTAMRSRPIMPSCSTSTSRPRRSRARSGGFQALWRTARGAGVTGGDAIDRAAKAAPGHAKLGLRAGVVWVRG